VTGIVGYPPTLRGEEVAAQVRALHGAGWRRFKLPVAATPELTRERFHAAHSVADDITVAMDAAWVFRDADAAAALVAGFEKPLDWYEDVFPPGDAAIVRALRDRVPMPVAMGDEQGGAYFPEALLLADAVDIVRLDATCMGGLSRFRAMIETVEGAGKRFTPHMFTHAHQPILAALGHGDAPMEWGIPGTGVDPYADSLPAPVVRDGRMDPLGGGDGFGVMANTEWIRGQEVDDPDGLLDALDAAG
jgi:L-alanine-DL-glutamate epimerase-like enolase superfamily enzyme